MALGTPTQLGSTQAGTSSPQTISSISPAANALILVCAGISGSATTTGDITVSTTISGLSFTEVEVGGGAGTSQRIIVAYGVTGSSPGTGNITVTYAGTPTHARSFVLQITGADTTTPVVGTVSIGNQTATSLSQTVTTAPATSDILFALAGSRNDTNGITLGASFTSIVNAFSGSPSASLLAQYRTGTTSTTVDASGMSTSSNSIIGFVVKQAAAGGTTPVTGSRVTTWTVGATVTPASRATTWTVRTPVTPSNRATTWHTGLSDYDKAVVVDNPRAYFRVTGSAENDLAGNGHTITYTGSPTTTTMPNGDTIAKFNGTTQYADIADADDLSVPTTGILTLEVWMRPDSIGPFQTFTGTGNYVNWIGKGDNDSPGNNEYLGRMYPVNYAPRPNRISGYAFNPTGGTGVGSYFEGGISGTPYLHVGDWVQWTLIIDTTDLGDGWGTTKLYRNGVLKDTDTLITLSIDPQNGDAPLRVATSDLAAFFEGAIGKVAVYDYALSTTRMLAHRSAMYAGITALASPATRATTWSVAEPGGGTTPVTGSRATTWSVAATVAASRATTWTARAVVAGTRATSWVVRSVATSTRATTWQVRTPVASTRATTWSVLTPASSTRATTWTVRTPVTAATRATTWQVRAAVSGTRATTWVTRVQVASTRGTSWLVLSPVSGSRSTLWHTRAAPAATRVTTWSVLTPVAASSRATTWRALAPVTTTRATTWHTDGNLTVVSATRATTWEVIGRISGSRATTWTVRTPLTVNRSTTWTASGLVTVSRATTWAARSLISGTRATTWNQRAVTGTARTTTWDVAGALTTVTASRATTWDVVGAVAALVPVTGTRATTWSTLLVVTAHRSTLWAVGVGVTADRTTVWVLAAGVTAVRDTRWAVFSDLVTGWLIEDVIDVRLGTVQATAMYVGDVKVWQPEGTF